MNDDNDRSDREDLDCAACAPPDAPWFDKPARLKMIEDMREAAKRFYGAAVGTRSHAFLEFTGLMNEYVAIAEHAESQGNEHWPQANQHIAIPLPLQPHNVVYLADKLACIYGQTLRNNNQLRRLFTEQLLGRAERVRPPPGSSSAHRKLLDPRISVATRILALCDSIADLRALAMVHAEHETAAAFERDILEAFLSLVVPPEIGTPESVQRDRVESDGLVDARDVQRAIDHVRRVLLKRSPLRDELLSEERGHSYFSAWVWGAIEEARDQRESASAALGALTRKEPKR